MRKRAERLPPLVTPEFVLVVVSTFAYFLCVGMLFPVFPFFIEGPLGGSDVAVGVSGGAFSLSAVLLRPFAGRWGDRRGHRPLIVLGAVIVAASVIANAAVESLVTLMALRLFAGVGEAMFFVGAAAAVNDLAPEERRGEAVSLFSLALYGGISFGPIIGEALFESTSFSTVWVVAGASGAIAAVLGLRVRDARPERGEGPPPRLVHPAGVLPGLVLFCAVWGFAAFNSFVALYAKDDLGMSGSRFVFFTYSFTVLLIRLFGARIPDLLGSRRAASIATSTITAGMLIIAGWQEPAGLYVGAFVFGIGQAFAFPALMTLAIRGAPAFERGAVVGTYSAFVDLAFGAGALSMGPIAHSFGYPATFTVSAGFALAGLALLRLKVPDDRPARPARTEVEAPPAESGHL
jgi:MFS family permease